MKTLGLNVFLSSFLTAFLLFGFFTVFFQVFNPDLITGLIFFVVLLPIAANLSSIFFSSTKNLRVALLGMLIFYGFMIFMTYETDIAVLILYSIVPAVLLITVYNIRQIAFSRRKT